jgi:hypothetical protein
MITLYESILSSTKTGKLSTRKGCFEELKKAVNEVFGKYITKNYIYGTQGKYDIKGMRLKNEKDVKEIIINWEKLCNEMYSLIPNTQIKSKEIMVRNSIKNAIISNKRLSDYNAGLYSCSTKFEYFGIPMLIGLFYTSASYNSKIKEHVFEIIFNIGNNGNYTNVSKSELNELKEIFYKD